MWKVWAQLLMIVLTPFGSCFGAHARRSGLTDRHVAGAKDLRDSTAVPRLT
jgi:hypothetical protein